MFQALPAVADENLFGYSYSAETLPRGGMELYQWITLRDDKGRGTYRATDAQTEFEYGITDRIQGSFYVTGRSHTIRGVSEPDDTGMSDTPDLERGLSFDGVKASVKFNVLSPFKDAMGLAFYVEPAYSTVQKVRGEKAHQRSVELRAMLQKNFVDDRWVWVINLWLEPEWRKLDGGGARQTEIELEIDSGVSYRFAPRWFAGLEFRYHSEYPQESTDGEAGYPGLQLSDREHHAEFLGPTLHFGDRRWWWTFTLLHQFNGRPLDPEVSDHLHFGEHERNEYRLKLGYNF